jgi:hypothetical protein
MVEVVVRYEYVIYAFDFGAFHGRSRVAVEKWIYYNLCSAKIYEPCGMSQPFEFSHIITMPFLVKKINAFPILAFTSGNLAY